MGVWRRLPKWAASDKVLAFSEMCLSNFVNIFDKIYLAKLLNIFIAIYMGRLSGACILYFLPSLSWELRVLGMQKKLSGLHPRYIPRIIIVQGVFFHWAFPQKFQVQKS